MAMEQQPPPPTATPSTSSMNVSVITSPSSEERPIPPLPLIEITELVPEDLIFPEFLPYMMQQAIVLKVTVLCINASPYRGTNLLMTLRDFSTLFLSRMSLAACRVISDALKICLYKPNPHQLRVLRAAGKCVIPEDGENDVALIEIRSMMRYLPWFKYVQQSGLTREEPLEPTLRNTNITVTTTFVRQGSDFENDSDSETESAQPLSSMTFQPLAPESSLYTEFMVSSPSTSTQPQPTSTIDITTLIVREENGFSISFV